MTCRKHTKSSSYEWNNKTVGTMYKVHTCTIISYHLITNEENHGSWFSYSTFSMKAFILFWKEPLPQKLGLKCDKKARMLLRLHWLSYFFSRHLENERLDFLVTQKLEIQNYIWRGFCDLCHGNCNIFWRKNATSDVLWKGYFCKTTFPFSDMKKLTERR